MVCIVFFVQAAKEVEKEISALPLSDKVMKLINKKLDEALGGEGEKNK